MIALITWSFWLVMVGIILLCNKYPAIARQMSDTAWNCLVLGGG
jgi:hypothetical protein